MKILALSHGCDVVIYSTLARMAQTGGYDVVVACDSQGANRVPPSCRQVEIPPIKSKLSLKAAKALKRVVKEEKPDAILAVSTAALSVALMAARSSSARIVGYRGTQAKVHRFDPTYRMALLNPRVDHVICETADIEQYLRRYIPAEKLSWRSKPFEVDWLGDALTNPLSNGEAPADALKLIYIGISKGRPHKGLDYLIEAMDTLKDDNVHLTVIGEADPKHTSRLRPNVTFLGNRPDAVNYLPTHDLFMLTSTRDASPRVVREAQACGVPCVVSDILGARDLIIDGESGILVEPASPKAIVKAVRSFIGKPERLRAMGEAARRNIIGNFKMESYVEYYKTVFRP